MKMLDFDKQTKNTVVALDAGVTAAQAEYKTAKAASDALAQRLSTFSAELDVAQVRLATAKSDSAAADATEQSVDDALLEALKATRQALIIYASARRALALAEKAARQTVAAGYLVAETLKYVTTASDKNSFITRKLLAGAEQADADASAAVSAAIDALRDAMDAFIATERAAGASFLVVASLVNLQMLMSGYEKPPRSNEDELPSALLVIPALDLSALTDDDAMVVRKLDEFLLQQTPELIKPGAIDKLSSDNPSSSADLLELAVRKYMHGTEKRRSAMVKRIKDKASVPLRKTSGLQPGFKMVHAVAQAYETEMQDATLLTQEAATTASQELSRKAARLLTAQHALTAARQAAGA